MNNAAKTNFLKQDISRSFNSAADTYDDAAFLQREVADRLFQRLDYIRIQPQIILDLGSGTGYCAHKLEQRYKKARIISLDLAESMLLKGKSSKRWFNRRYSVCSDAQQLPFESHSIDLIFSNLMLHWVNDLGQTLKEIKRVLKPNGLFLFSTLGPDTLFELRQSWGAVDDRVHVHPFQDMHIVGDLMQRIRFKDPVVDMEFITITYNDLKKILIDLKDLGTHNIAKHRLKGLTGKEKFKQFEQAYEQYRNAEGLIPVTYEVIYGLAWGKEENSSMEVNIPIESILRRNSSSHE